MLECPKCGTSVDVSLPTATDLRVNDMADLSREKRRLGGVGVIKCYECHYEGDPLEFDPRSALPKVADCYITTNGMVMACGADGAQIPECQGFILVIGSELKFRCDEHTTFCFRKRGAWLEEADFSWWWNE